MASGRYEEAQRAYEKLRELEPGVAEVHANLGLIYFEEKKFEQAVAALRQALKLKPSLIKADNILAMSLSELGRYSEALPGLEKGFGRSTDPEIRRMCGLQLLRAYTGLKRDDKAVEVGLQLNRLYADDPEVLYQTGKITGASPTKRCTSSGMWDLIQFGVTRRRQKLTKVRTHSIKPSYNTELFSRPIRAALISENKPEEALLHLQKAVAINLQNEVAWYRLAIVQRALGNNAAQEKTLAEFKRLHEKSSQQNLTTNFLTPQEVTKPEIDANASH